MATTVETGARDSSESLSLPYEQIPEQDPDDRFEPRQLRIYELSVRTAPGRLEFCYSGASGPIPVRDHADFLAKLKAVVASNAPSLPAPKPAPPMPSPLSVHNDDLSYVVFLLDRGWNWQFARQGGVITVEKGVGDYFREARRVDDHGTATDRRTPAPVDGAMAAYVIAHGARARRHSPGDSYSHEFNLHVEFLGRDRDGHAAYRQPLIIDPDIRYPGGS